MGIKIAGHRYVNLTKTECEVCKKTKTTGILHREHLEMWDYEYYSICKECLSSEGYLVQKTSAKDEIAELYAPRH